MRNAKIGTTKIRETKSSKCCKNKNNSFCNVKSVGENQKIHAWVGYGMHAGAQPGGGAILPCPLWS